MAIEDLDDFCCNLCDCVVGEDNFGRWKDRILSATAEAPGPASVGTLVLAERRTKRPDILSGFRWYRGGWDIANKHYWAVSSISFFSSCFAICFIYSNVIDKVMKS